MTTKFIVDNFNFIYDEFTLKYPKMNNLINKSIAIIFMLRVYEDVDNIKDMIKDNAFVKLCYNEASIKFNKSVSNMATNSLLVDGKLKNIYMNNKFEFSDQNIEKLSNDY